MEKEISIKLMTSESNDVIDYQFYWRLFKYYLSLFDNPVFVIPYVIRVEDQNIACSYKIDLTAVKYDEVIEKLHEIESSKEFIGFQIPIESE